MSQPPYSGPPYPEQPNQGQPYSGQPWSGQPNPDVPTSVPPQPGYPSYGQQPGHPSPGEPQQPYYGQPVSGQPVSGQPVSGQPQYGQPPYGQTQPLYGRPQSESGQPQQGQNQYGQPTYPQPDQAGAFPSPPPKKKSKALPIALISVAVFLVLCVGGGTAVFIATRKTADKVNEALQSPGPTQPGTSQSTGEATKAPTSTITVVEPKTLGGRPKLTDPQFAPLAAQLKTGLSDVPGETNTVGTLYGSVAKRNIVVVAAAAAPIDDPKKELDNEFTSAGFSGLAISDITTVNPGPLGGAAKCGKANQEDVTMAICTWADDGSIGMMIFFFQSVSKVKTEFATLRGQVEKKSS